MKMATGIPQSDASRHEAYFVRLTIKKAGSVGIRTEIALLPNLVRRASLLDAPVSKGLPHQVAALPVSRSLVRLRSMALGRLLLNLVALVAALVSLES